MNLNIYNLISITGLILIIIGVLLSTSKKDITRKYSYILLTTGGILLEIYSIYIKDIIFIILQAFFTISAIYGLIKLNNYKN